MICLSVDRKHHPSCPAHPLAHLYPSTHACIFRIDLFLASDVDDADFVNVGGGY